MRRQHRLYRIETGSRALKTLKQNWYQQMFAGIGYVAIYLSIIILIPIKNIVYLT